jgi:hypothetical protein
MRRHLAGSDGDGLAIMSGFSFRACKDDFTAGKHARERRFRASIALSRPAMRRTARFFEIILNPGANGCQNRGIGSNAMG